jgi:hypothetical protein
MKIEIDDSVLAGTTLCEKNFACLLSEKNVCMKVDQCLISPSMLVNCLESNCCTYKFLWGDSTIRCTCPTRLEMFRKYDL